MIPNGRVILYSGVPLSKNKPHRILLNNDDEFFNGLNERYKVIEYNHTLTFDEQTTRSIKLSGLAIDYYNVNYLCLIIINSNGQAIRQYAFVDEIKYINDTMYLLTYTLDLFSTFIYKMNLNKTGYVLKHHVNDDTIGLHKVNENLDTGILKYKGISNIQSLIGTSIVINTSIDFNLEEVTGDIYGGVYSSGALLAFPRDRLQITLLQGYLRDLNSLGKIDAIQNIFICPSDAVPINDDFSVIPNQNSVSKTWEFDKVYSSIDGYVPKNNKLFVYPYNYLTVTNNQGEMIKLEFDLFETNKCTFRYDMVPTQGECVLLRPENYASGSDFMFTLGLGNYPSVSWINDQYANWLAQTQHTRSQQNINSFVGGVSGIIGSSLSLNPEGAVNSAVNGILTLEMNLAKKADYEIQPNLIRNATDLGNLNIAMFRKTYQAYVNFISKEYAKIIDDEFSAYGYTILETIKPNFYGRLNWNFVKVLDYPIIGDISSVAKNEINLFLESGVTLWHTWDVGNYNLNNNIVGGV